LFPSDFPTKVLDAFLISHARYMPRPSCPRFDHSNTRNIWWRERTNYEAPHYAVPCSLLLFRPSQVQIFCLSTMFSDTLVQEATRKLNLSSCWE
jgi:hypothetical protein